MPTAGAAVTSADASDLVDHRGLPTLCEASEEVGNLCIGQVFTRRLQDRERLVIDELRLQQVQPPPTETSRD